MVCVLDRERLCYMYLVKCGELWIVSVKYSQGMVSKYTNMHIG